MSKALTGKSRHSKRSIRSSSERASSKKTLQKRFLCEAYQRSRPISPERVRLLEVSLGDSSPSHHPHLLRAGPSSLRARQAPDKMSILLQCASACKEKGPLHPRSERRSSSEESVGAPGGRSRLQENGSAHGIISSAHGEAQAEKPGSPAPVPERSATLTQPTGGRRRDLFTLKKTLGHRSLSSTLFYTQYCPDASCRAHHRFLSYVFPGFIRRQASQRQPLHNNLQPVAFSICAPLSYAPS